MIEDDFRLAAMVTEYLGEAGLRVEVARDGPASRGSLDRRGTPSWRASNRSAPAISACA
jgi:DNA-binding response OmpR family regulator